MNSNLLTKLKLPRRRKTLSLALTLALSAALLASCGGSGQEETAEPAETGSVTESESVVETEPVEETEPAEAAGLSEEENARLLEEELAKMAGFAENCNSSAVYVHFIGSVDGTPLEQEINLSRQEFSEHTFLQDINQIRLGDPEASSWDTTYKYITCCDSDGSLYYYSGSEEDDVWYPLSLAIMLPLDMRGAVEQITYAAADAEVTEEAVDNIGTVRAVSFSMDGELLRKLLVKSCPHLLSNSINDEDWSGFSTDTTMGFYEYEFEEGSASQVLELNFTSPDLGDLFLTNIAESDAVQTDSFEIVIMYTNYLEESPAFDPDTSDISEEYWRLSSLNSVTKEYLQSVE